jgi:hypothetical protein
MGKVRVVTLLMAVACLVGLVGVTAGDSTGTLGRGWWTPSRQFVPMGGRGVSPRQAAVAAKAQLDAYSPKRWSIQWNQKTGLLEELWGRTADAQSGTPEQAAQLFLRACRPLLTGLAPERDKGHITFHADTTLGTGSEPDPNIVRFSEFYKGVRVYLGGVSVFLEERGRVTGVVGAPYSVDSLDVTPSMSPDAILENLRTALLPDSMGSTTAPEVVIYPSDPPRLAYRSVVTVHMAGRPWGSEFLLDAETGEALQVTNLFKVEFPIYPTDSGGVGSIEKDTGGLIESPPEGHDYLGRVPVLQLSPGDSGGRRDTAPPPAFLTRFWIL